MRWRRRITRTRAAMPCSSRRKAAALSSRTRRRGARTTPSSPAVPPLRPHMRRRRAQAAAGACATWRRRRRPRHRHRARCAAPNVLALLELAAWGTHDATDALLLLSIRATISAWRRCAPRFPHPLPTGRRRGTACGGRRSLFPACTTWARPSSARCRPTCGRSSAASQRPASHRRRVPDGAPPDLVLQPAGTLLGALSARVHGRQRRRLPGVGVGAAEGRDPRRERAQQAGAPQLDPRHRGARAGRTRAALDAQAHRLPPAHAEEIDRKGKTISENTSLLTTRWSTPATCASARAASTPRPTASRGCATATARRRLYEIGGNRSCGWCDRARQPGAGRAAAALTCVDDHGTCTEWALEGSFEEPRLYARFVQRRVRTVRRVHDRSADCKRRAASGECTANGKFMREQCPFACDWCNADGSVHRSARAAPTRSPTARYGRSWASARRTPILCVSSAARAASARVPPPPPRRRPPAAAAGRTWSATAPRGSPTSSASGTGGSWRRPARARAGGAAARPPPRRYCDDEDAKCETWAKSGECQRNENFMSRECRRSWEAAPAPPPPPPRSRGRRRTPRRRAVVRRRRAGRRRSARPRRSPRSRIGGRAAGAAMRTLCARWADDGQCTANPQFAESSVRSRAARAPPVRRRRWRRKRRRRRRRRRSLPPPAPPPPPGRSRVGVDSYR